GGDDDVGSSQSVPQAVKRNGVAAQLTGQLGGALPGAVADQEAGGDTLRQEEPGRLLARLTGANDQRRARLTSAEDLLGELDSGPTDRDGSPGDFGLRPNALARLDGVPE